jgi:hypothetical protein
MNVAWMMLMLVDFAAKVLPYRRSTAIGVRVALLLLGIVVACGATGRPWTVRGAIGG